MAGVPGVDKLPFERERLMAVVIPLVKGDAIKANFCLTFPPNLERGEGGADTELRSMVVGLWLGFGNVTLSLLE